MEIRCVIRINVPKHNRPGIYPRQWYEVGHRRRETNGSINCYFEICVEIEKNKCLLRYTLYIVGRNNLWYNV